MQVSIQKLRVNPAQGRTRITADGLAALALQMANPDPALALLVKQDGEYFDVISGHRRWLAAMIAWMAVTHSLEQMETVIEDYCDPFEDGWIELSPDLYAWFINMVEEFTLPCTLWEGSKADEVLTLLRANMGAEAPDLVGLAKAFHIAIERGIEIEALAQATGIPESTADAILIIPVLPTVFQQLINDHRLGLEILPDLDELAEDTLQTLGAALEDFLEMNIGPEHMDYTARVRSALVNLRWKSRAPAPKDSAPQAFNEKRMAHKLWQKAVTETPEALQRAAALIGLKATGRMNLAALLSDVPSTKRYFDVDRYGWTKLNTSAVEVLDDLSCDTCAFAGLPEARLSVPLDLLCRKHKVKGLPEEGCMHWVPEGKSFHLRTPWGWQAGSTVVTNLKQLVEAWQKQRDFELKQGIDPVGEEDAAGSTAMQLQRGSIRQYMERHTEPPFTLDHPWSVACEQCHYFLEESPVQSAPDAPHCWWSKGRRQLRWQAFWPCDEEGTAIKPPDIVIPSCLQFAPNVPWSDIITETTAAAPFPREVMVKLIMDLAKSANRETHSPHSRGALQFLTGRPEKATGNHRHTFSSRFRKEKDGLSDRQMWQLVLWLLLDWQRGRAPRLEMELPFDEGRTRHFRIMEFTWAIDLLDEPDEDE